MKTMGQDERHPSGRQQTAGQFVRFAAVGAIATALHYGIYLAAWRWLALAPGVAYTLVYVLIFAANFLLTAWFTFRTVPTWRRLAGMVGAHAVNYGLHIVLLHLFLWMGVPPEWAPAPVYAVAVPVNFVLVRSVFRGRKAKRPDPGCGSSR